MLRTKRRPILWGSSDMFSLKNRLKIISGFLVVALLAFEAPAQGR